METFIIKLAISIIPMIILVASVNIISSICSWYSRHPMFWQRKESKNVSAIESSAVMH